MNERIQELAEKAGIKFMPMIVDDVEYDYYHVHCDDYVSGKDEASCVRKFAELIVRECMKLNRDILCEDDPDYLDKMYKDHFGVTE